MSFKTILLDLGGVVIDLNRDASVERLQALGMMKAAEYLDLYCQSGPFLQLETGKVTAAEFFDEVRPQCVAGTTDSDITDAFNAFLTGLPAERLAAIRALRAAGYKVIMISNTNPVMFHSWIEEHFRAEGLAVNDYFDGIVTSFQEGCCKPDSRIFEILMRRYSLRPEETLLLDDGPANCEAAAALGIATCRITAEMPLVKVAQRLIEEKA